MQLSGRSWVLWVLLALGVVGGFRLYRSLVPATKGPLASIRVEEAVAFQLGAAAGRTAGDGEVLVLQLPALTKAERTVGRRVREAVARGLGTPVSALAAGGPETLTPEARGDLALRAMNGDWGAEFQAWTAGHPRARAVVCLLPLPGRIPPDGPPVFSFTVGREDAARRRLAEKRIRGLVVPRPEARLQQPPAPGDTEQAIFDARFVLLSR